MDKTEHIILESKPRSIHNIFWFDEEGDLFLRSARIARTDFLRFVKFLVDNAEYPDEILSECFEGDTIKEYARKKYDMMTFDEFNTSPEEGAR